ncbi:ADP-ribosylhydrolase ARH1-like [Grus japonensis]|uniref:ADP-ribosylhydrolase ARH1-like n=1 Tax=Grus japonensis TaxID=30415 RepID=A0ABC9XVB6_GRUJA
MEETAPSVEDYEAAMVLSGVGDALGYRGGRWEYCTSGPQIHAELAELGGLEAITLQPPEWPVSDDTILHLATAEGLATVWVARRGGPHCPPHPGLEGEPLLQELAHRYVAAMSDMEGRKPGPTSILGTSQLRPGEPGGYRIPFNPTGTGCGAAMRSLAIGLRYLVSQGPLESHSPVTPSVTGYPVVTGDTNDPNVRSDTNVPGDSNVPMSPASLILVSLLTPIFPVTLVSPCPQ